VAEPTNPGQPSDSATERGSPVNVNTSGDVTVTRRNVATGDLKDEQTELLRQLVDCCDEQTRSLGKLIKDTKKEISDSVSSSGGTTSPDAMEQLKNINENLKALLSKASGGGGEGGGGGEEGISFAGAQAARKVFEASEEAAEIFQQTKLPAFSKFFKLFKQGAVTEFEKNMLSVNQSVIDFGQSLMDVQGAARDAMGTIDEMFKAGQGGMIGVTALLDDLGAGLLKNRDALNSTFPVVMEFAEQQRLLIGTLGSNLEEVAQTFKENRDAAKEAFGAEFLERIPFEEMNVIQTQILEQQRRAGVQASNDSILTSRQTRDQIQLLKDIAFATGKTVAEVMKLQEDDAMTLEELRFNGLISQQTLESMRAQRTMFESQGLGSLSDLVQEIVEAGGIDMFQRREGAALMMSQGNNDALVRELFRISQSSTGGTPEALQRMIELASGLEGLTGQTMEAASVLREDSGNRFQALAEVSVNAERIISAQVALAKEGKDATLEALREQQKATEGTMDATAQGMFNTFQETIKNNLGGGAALVVALGANTAAIIANTLARGGLGRGMMGRLGGKMKGGFGGAVNAARGGVGSMARGAGGLISGAGAATVAAGAAAGFGLHQAGQAVFTGRSDVYDFLKDIAPETTTNIGDAVGSAVDNVLSFFGNDEATKRLNAMEQFEQMKLAEKKAKIDSALNRKQGVSAVKGVAPQSAGDAAVVAPSDVTKPEIVSLKDDPTNVELAKQTNQLDQLIQLTIAGNAARTDTLDAINKSGGPAQTGKKSIPMNRRGTTTGVSAYTPLLDQ